MAACNYTSMWFQVYILFFVLFSIYINVVSTMCKIKVREATSTSTLL